MDAILVLWAPLDRGKLGNLFKVFVVYSKVNIHSSYFCFYVHFIIQLLTKLLTIHFPGDLNN